VPGRFQISFVLGGEVYLLSLVLKSTEAGLVVISFESDKVISFGVHEQFDRGVARL